MLDQLANTTTEGRTVLVPMTQSLYVPGEITDASTVMVDVGTGYFVKKSNADAKEVLERRMVMVRDSIDKLTKTIAFKQSELEKIKRVVTIGVQEQMARLGQSAQQQPQAQQQQEQQQQQQ